MNLASNSINATSREVRVAVMVILLLTLSSVFMINLPSSRADTNLASTSVQYITNVADDPSMIIYLSLLEGKGSMALDISGFKNHGMLYPDGNIEWLPNGGLHFNGVNNGMTINASASLRSAHKTVIMKFMWDGKTTDSEMYLYDDGWADNGSFIMFVHPETSRLYVEFKTMNGTQKNLWHSIVANEVYTAIFGFDGSRYSLWLNNQEKSGSFKTFETLQTNHRIVIGSDWFGKKRRFSGQIYAVKILNRGLTSIESLRQYEGFQEASRFNPLSKRAIGGWVYYTNDSSNVFPLQPIQVCLNQTMITSSDEYGAFKFVFDLPQEAGNHTYVVTVNNNTLNVLSTNVVVDRVMVHDSGSTHVTTGNEAVAWFKLASEFDGQPVESGVVSLTGGLNATWNSTALRWEYREIRNDAGNLTLHIESVIWDKYGITSLSPTSLNEVTMEWVTPPWYVTLLPWFTGVGPALFGIVGIIALLAILVRFGVIKLSAEELPGSTEQLREEIDRLIKSSSLGNRESIILSQILERLLDENPSQEVLDSLRNFIPTLIKDFRDQSNVRKDDNQQRYEL